MVRCDHCDAIFPESEKCHILTIENYGIYTICVKCKGTVGDILNPLNEPDTYSLTLAFVEQKLIILRVIANKIKGENDWLKDLKSSLKEKSKSDKDSVIERDFV